MPLRSVSLLLFLVTDEARARYTALFLLQSHYFEHMSTVIGSIWQSVVDFLVGRLLVGCLARWDPARYAWGDVNVGANVSSRTDSLCFIL